LAEKNNLKVAFSNESFELWYLLHFIYFDSNISRKDYISKLKEYLPEYKKNDPTIYSKILDKQDDAIKNALRLISISDLRNPNKAEPCTKVVELVTELNKYL
jgi:hypothetical protein